MEALMPILTTIGSAMSSVAPVLGAASSAIGLGKELFGGGGGGGGSATPATVAPATSPTTPTISAGDYTNQQNAYYKQMLAGLGMGTPGGELPPGIQEAIDRQASMLGG